MPNLISYTSTMVTMYSLGSPQAMESLYATTAYSFFVIIIKNVNYCVSRLYKLLFFTVV